MGSRLSSGALLVLGAAVAQAAFFVAQKPLLRRYGGLELTAWAMAIGALLTLPLAGGLPHARAAAPARATLAILFLGLGASAIGFVAWACGLRAARRLHRRGHAVRRPRRGVGIGRAWLGERRAPSRSPAARSRWPASSSPPSAGSPSSVDPAQGVRRPKPRRRSSARPPSVPAPRQHAELDGRVVGVEERADAVQPPSRSSQKNDDVDHDEAWSAASPPSGARWVPSSFAGAAACVPSLSRGPVGVAAARRGTPTTARGARARSRPAPSAGRRVNGSS